MNRSRSNVIIDRDQSMCHRHLCYTFRFVFSSLDHQPLSVAGVLSYLATVLQTGEFCESLRPFIHPSIHR